MVMLAALGVHFKLKQIYKTLVHSYQARSGRCLSAREKTRPLLNGHRLTVYCYY